MRTTLGTIVSQHFLRKRFLREFNTRPNISSLAICLGWNTTIIPEVNEGTPSATLRRANLQLGPRQELYADGTQISAELPFSEIALRHPFAQSLVVAPFVEDPTDGNHDAYQQTLQDPPIDKEAFRFDPRLYFLNPSFRPLNPEAMREYLMLRADDPIFFQDMVENFQEPMLGWGNAMQTSSPTGVSLQALYYCSVLQRALGQHAALKAVEIGGGFGNFARIRKLTSPRMFTSHTIIDLPTMLDLQQWFLRGCFPATPQELGTCDRIGQPSFQFLNADGLDRYDLQPDIVIATHSLSELDPATIRKYISTVVLRSKYFFFVYYRKFFDSKMGFDWVVRELLNAGWRFRHIDCISGTACIAVLMERP